MRHPARQRRLLASLAEAGQQTPIVVVAAEGQADRYVVIDGYKRILARGPRATALLPACTAWLASAMGGFNCGYYHP